MCGDILHITFIQLLGLTTRCTGGSPFSMLSGASRGEQKGSLTTGELSTFISVRTSVRRGSKPRGNSREYSSSDPSSLAGAAMATEDMSMDVDVSVFLEKTVTSSGYDKEKEKKKDNSSVVSAQQSRKISIIMNRII